MALVGIVKFVRSAARRSHLVFACIKRKEKAVGYSVSRKIYAIVSSLLLVLTSLLTYQPVAQATGTVRIDNVRVESENTPIKNLSFVHVRWDWYAGNVSNGQQFSVEFPDVLQLGSDQGIELRDADGVVGGTCNANNDTRIVTCTFNDKFSHKDNVHGMFEVQVQVAKVQKSKEITFKIDGVSRVVHLPGPDDQDGIIGADYTAPKTFSKEGWSESDKVHARWTISVPGSELLKHNINSDVVIEDELTLVNGDVGHKFIKDWGEYAVEYTKDQLDNPRENGKPLAF